MDVFNVAIKSVTINQCFLFIYVFSISNLIGNILLLAAGGEMESH